MNSTRGVKIETRPCGFCGKPVPVKIRHCPYCREAIPEVQLSNLKSSQGGREIRRGLLYLLLGSVIYYFTHGYSAMPLPAAINPIVTVYLAPILFLGGAGLCLYGVFLRLRG
jgi:hypothetical protein